MRAKFPSLNQLAAFAETEAKNFFVPLLDDRLSSGLSGLEIKLRRHLRRPLSPAFLAPAERQCARLAARAAVVSLDALTK